MTDTSLSPRETDEALAAEYVLGVHDLTERAMIETRIKREPGFAALVTDWEFRLGGMNDDFGEAEAPDLLPKIEARLFATVAAPRKTWFGLGFGWLTGAAVAAVLALVSITTLAPPRPELIATLATADNRLSYRVTHFGETLQVTRVAGAPAATGQVHELWIIAPDAGPVSLGLLDDNPLVITYPTPPDGYVLAVSVEPAGGSPSGQPTGPVILTAKVGTSA